MSMFAIVWRKYNLRDDPYFQEPLAISEGKIPMSSFVGRKQEIRDIVKMVEMGSGRFLIIGDAGVGKTTVVNYVRAKAREGEFFSPEDEIEINSPMNAQEFAINTLNCIFREIKKLNISISQELETSLDNLFSITSHPDFTAENNLSKLSYEKLKELFKKTIKEVVHPRFKGVILHYDNLDNIKVPESIEDMLGEIRDLLLIPNIIFFFVGNKFLPEDIGYSKRVRQIFYFPPTEIPELKFNDVKKILDERIKHLKINNNLDATTPHTEQTLKILFDLHNGNLRDTLKSLYACVMELARANTPIKIDEILMRKLLVKKVERDYLSGLTDTEKEILNKILNYGKSITPSEISKITGKNRQNIASKYIPKLMRKSALEFDGKEGRNTFYKVSPEIMWWKLQSGMKGEDLTEKKKKEIERKLSEFI